MANTTAMASGVNRYLAVPVSSRTGTKTMQIESGRDKGRNGDLRCSVEHGADQRLAHGDVAMSVLDLDRGIVHQNADGERQATQCHHVDGLSEEAQYAE